MTPTAATPSNEIRLERYRVTKLNAGQAPYRRDAAGEYHTNRIPVYVQRVAGKPRNVRVSPEHGYVRLLSREELEAAEKVAARRKWELDVRRADLVIPKYSHLEGDLDCNADLLRRLDKVAAELGVTIFVRSGYRSLDEQWALYRQNMAAPGVPKPGRPLTAYPNASAPHVRGVAADCGIDGVNLGAWKDGRARSVLLKHGLCLPVASESWHVEVGARARWATNWLPK